MDELDYYFNCFVNRTDCWGRQWVNRDGSYCGYIHQNPTMDTKQGKYLFEPITLKLLLRHFKGEVTISLAAMDALNQSKWIAFDSDSGDGALDFIEESLKLWGAYTIREGRRPGRDGHLWLLMDKPVAASLLISLGRAILRIAQVESKIEIFPKSATKYSQLRAPLGINLKPEATGARGWFEGAEKNILSQLKWLARQPRNRSDLFVREAQKYLKSCSPALSALESRSKNGPARAGFKILDHVDYRQIGESLVAQCPVCAIEGHDKHKDNLRIAGDGIKFCCVYGGPSQIHKASDIKNALLG